MQIVIDIDDKVYGLLKYFENGFGFDDKDDKKDDDVKTALMRAVLNGTPIPKGHGRLIDMKRLKKFVTDYCEYDAVQLIRADRKDYLPTIIEADDEERSEE